MRTQLEKDRRFARDHPREQILVDIGESIRTKSILKNVFNNVLISILESKDVKSDWKFLLDPSDARETPSIHYEHCLGISS